MKRVLLVILLLGYLFCSAQNYQCLQSGTKHYFINGNGYLRGIRIDSVKTYADSTVYYPFHTPRGKSSYPSVLDSTSGSWLGKYVKQLTDGTFLFDNLWGDTIVIKTQANVGDSWIFCRDTTSLYYLATMIGADTATIQGSIDSIKVIVITAHNSSGIVTSDPVNSFQIILTKNRGFAQVFDLYTFPYHQPNLAFTVGQDFYLDKSTTRAYESYSAAGYPPSVNVSIFKLITFINPTYQQLYDFNIGDVFLYRECLLPDGVNCDYSYAGEPPVRSFFEFDSITDKILIGGITKYHFEGRSSYPNPFNIHYTPDPGFQSITLDSSTLIDTLLMPEEYKQHQIYYYFPADTSYCVNSPYYDIVPNYLFGQTAPFYFEGPITDVAYKLGLGQVVNYRKGTSTLFFEIESSGLVFYKNSLHTCGEHPSSIVDTRKNSKILLFPNPAISELSISAPSPITSVVIYSLLSQIVYTREYNTDKVQIDVSNLPKGIYILRINGTEVTKFVKE